MQDSLHGMRFKHFPSLEGNPGRKVNMRYYKFFKTRKEQIDWEAQKIVETPGFKVCMRLTGKQIKDELPFINIVGYNFASIWREE